jgi:hypothetical protein
MPASLEKVIQRCELSDIPDSIPDSILLFPPKTGVEYEPHNMRDGNPQVTEDEISGA